MTAEMSVRFILALVNVLRSQKKKNAKNVDINRTTVYNINIETQCKVTLNVFNVKCKTDKI